MAMIASGFIVEGAIRLIDKRHHVLRQLVAREIGVELIAVARSLPDLPEAQKALNTVGEYLRENGYVWASGVRAEMREEK